jgi:hypothetical protein
VAILRAYIIFKEQGRGRHNLHMKLDSVAGLYHMGRRIYTDAIIIGRVLFIAFGDLLDLGKQGICVYCQCPLWS